MFAALFLTEHSNYFYLDIGLNPLLLDIRVGRYINYRKITESIDSMRSKVGRTLHIQYFIVHVPIKIKSSELTIGQLEMDMK